MLMDLYINFCINNFLQIKFDVCVTKYSYRAEKYMIKSMYTNQCKFITFGTTQNC